MLRWTYPEVPEPRGVVRPTFEDILRGVVCGDVNSGVKMGRVRGEDAELWSRREGSALGLGGLAQLTRDGRRVKRGCQKMVDRGHRASW